MRFNISKGEPVIPHLSPRPSPTQAKPPLFCFCSLLVLVLLSLATSAWPGKQRPEERDGDAGGDLVIQSPRSRWCRSESQRSLLFSSTRVSLSVFPNSFFLWWSGLTGSIILRNGRLSDVLLDLQVIVRIHSLSWNMKSRFRFSPASLVNFLGV